MSPLIIILSLILNFSIQNPYATEFINRVAFTEQASLQFPVRLKIPKINVDTVLERVGLTPKGAVDVPKDQANAAWFNLGPRPGENGSAVIVGHYGRSENGQGSVFDDLGKLKRGDELYVEDEKGATITFIVRESRTYDKNENALDVFKSGDGKSHLNLITCSGVWENDQKTYSNRLVVFTDRK